eukprot:scaffold754_cov133-Skeletonema_dohrnii-CCMP3373.AAC.7
MNHHHFIICSNDAITSAGDHLIDDVTLDLSTILYAKELIPASTKHPNPNKADTNAVLNTCLFFDICCRVESDVR